MIQDYINKTGRLNFTANTTVTEPIKVRADQDVLVTCEHGVEVKYQGPENTALFEFEPHQGQSPWVGRFQMRNFKGKAYGAEGLSIVKANFEGLECQRLTVEDCHVSASGYCFDFANTDYCVVPDFSRVFSGGGGAIRWTAKTSGRNIHHATSQAMFRNWRHLGKDRIGPAFHLRGHASLRMQDIIDEGKIGLRDDLVGQYKGPVNFLIESIRQGCYLDNFWIEPWGHWDNEAPECWMVEFRHDTIASTASTSYVTANGLKLAGSPSKNPIRVVCKPEIRIEGLVVEFVNLRWPKPDLVSCHGKCLVIYRGCMFPSGRRRDLLKETGMPVLNSVIWSTHNPPGIEAVGRYERTAEWYEPSGQ